MLRADEARDKVKAYNDAIIKENSDAIKKMETDIINRAENGESDIDILLSEYGVEYKYKYKMPKYFEGNGFSVVLGYKSCFDFNISW